MSNELVFMTATEIAQKIKNKNVSAVEVLNAHQQQIDTINPSVNAIITHTPELALKMAQEADAKTMRGDELGVLHGLPIAHKDLEETKGIRTTSGSPVFKDHIPDFDALLIERLKKAGCITLGKTNTVGDRQ